MTSQIQKTRAGFTLVELLVVISIIGLMFGLFLVAYQGAAQQSNVQKTRTTVQKIGDILNSRMEEYASYPLILRTPTGFPLPPNTTPITASPPESKTILLERARLLCLRELIAMEMPDHPDDIKWSDKWVTGQTMTNFLNSVPQTIPTGLAVGGAGVFVRNKPTSRVFGLAQKLSNAAGRPIPDWQTTNANAELLFLVVEDSEFDGSSAIESFGASEIGDKDGDGLNEFIDAFGQPIQWIRWPTAFEGISRYHPDLLDPGIITGSGASLRVTIETDPLDRMAADPGYGSTPLNINPGPGTTPLVISSGRDRQFGIRFEFANPMVGTTSYSVINSQWTIAGYLFGARITDPWYPRNSPADGLGSRIDTSGAWSDNVSNYDGNAESQ